MAGTRRNEKKIVQSLHHLKMVPKSCSKCENPMYLDSDNALEHEKKCTGKKEDQRGCTGKKINKKKKGKKGKFH